MKTICFFGSYNKTHRNISIMQGLRENGYTVIECFDDSKGLSKYYRLFKKHWQVRGTYDVLFVGFPNHGLVLFARLCTRKPVIFDPFISLYNTIVEDRRLHGWYSIAGIRSYVLDALSIRYADRVLTDTRAHAAYFSKTYKVQMKKFVVVPVGANDAFLQREKRAKPESEGKFSVRFYGSYSPLQGAQYIVDAAKLLLHEPDIQFELLGDGQTLTEVRARAEKNQLNNVTFISKRVPTEALIDFLCEADVCLGIFGGTTKSNMVVPHKVYDGLALGTAVLTGKTEAILEFFIDREHMLLCEEANARDLADKILELKNDTTLRSRIAASGNRLCREQFVPGRIVEQLLPVLESLTHKT